MKHESSYPSHPEPSSGEIFVSEAGFFLVVVGFFLTPCLCAKIPAAVELQADVVKASCCMCWRASLDGYRPFAKLFKESFYYFL